MALLLASACSPQDEQPEQPRDAGSYDEPDARVERMPDAEADARQTTPDGATKDGAADAAMSASDGGDAGEQGCSPFVMPAEVDCSPPEDGPLPRDLRCTGLYGDFEKRELACDVVEYKPALELWSDGAAKRRFVSIPRGEAVDVSDPNDFVYPLGTRFWKEFRVRGEDGEMRLAETRLLRKDPDGWVFTSYVWSEDEERAIQMDNAVGVPDLHGTGHIVPFRDHCDDCHKGRKDFVLGWDAIMLGPGAEGVTRDNLVELGFVEDASALQVTIPGNEVERAALGYLHANCGISCHNENPVAPGRESGLYLKLEAAELESVHTTDAVRSGLYKRAAPNAKLEGLPLDPDRYLGIIPGEPDRSLLLARQLLRGFEGQMPRIGTNEVDDAGVELTKRWIESMTPDAGYPESAP